ncbi:MAG: hypothetical protein IJB79_02670 [Candidatus Gastranaerophilales bacterium]|nr:hypothetical protein [Candidatus Gastranaerophilales bacterium]
MSDFQINNIGATIYGKDNGNGTYTVTTQGSKMGSEPTTKLMDAQEVGQKYGKYLSKTLTEDIFCSGCKNGENHKTDYATNPYYVDMKANTACHPKDYNPKVDYIV